MSWLKRWRFRRQYPLVARLTLDELDQLVAALKRLNGEDRRAA